MQEGPEKENKGASGAKNLFTSLLDRRATDFDTCEFSFPSRPSSRADKTPGQTLLKVLCGQFSEASPSKLTHTPVRFHFSLSQPSSSSHRLQLSLRDRLKASPHHRPPASLTRDKSSLQPVTIAMASPIASTSTAAVQSSAPRRRRSPPSPEESTTPPVSDRYYGQQGELLHSTTLQSSLLTRSEQTWRFCASM